MADPNEFMLMTHVREGETDRPEEFVGFAAQKKKEKPKKKWAAGDTSGASRVGDWLGENANKRSWKVKDLSKSTLGVLENTAKDEGASAPPKVAETTVRRWKPPAKSDAALPPWTSSVPTKTTTSGPPSKWAPRKNNPPPPPVNRPAPVPRSAATEREVATNLSSHFNDKKESEDLEEDLPPFEEIKGKDAVINEEVGAKSVQVPGSDCIDVVVAFQSEDLDSSSVAEKQLEDKLPGESNASVASSEHEVASESEHSAEYESTSHDDNDEEEEEKEEDILEDNDVKVESVPADVIVANGKDNDDVEEDDEPICSKTDTLRDGSHVLKEHKENNEIEASEDSAPLQDQSDSYSDASRSEEENGFEISEPMSPRNDESDHERVEMISDSEPDEHHSAKGCRHFEQPKGQIKEEVKGYQGPDPDAFKIMTMVRDGETDRPDDFVGMVSRSRTKKDAPRKRWGSTASTGSGRVDDWMGASGGGKPKKSWKVKG